jgi:hypothetical protein
MYGVPRAGPWWHAVGSPLERGVRHHSTGRDDRGVCESCVPAWLAVFGASPWRGLCLEQFMESTNPTWNAFFMDYLLAVGRLSPSRDPESASKGAQLLPLRPGTPASDSERSFPCQQVRGPFGEKGTDTLP